MQRYARARHSVLFDSGAELLSPDVVPVGNKRWDVAFAEYSAVVRRWDQTPWWDTNTLRKLSPQMADLMRAVGDAHGSPDYRVRWHKGADSWTRAWRHKNPTLLTQFKIGLGMVIGGPCLVVAVPLLGAVAMLYGIFEILRGVRLGFCAGRWSRGFAGGSLTAESVLQGGAGIALCGILCWVSGSVVWKTMKFGMIAGMSTILWVFLQWATLFLNPDANIPSFGNMVA